MFLQCFPPKQTNKPRDPGHGRLELLDVFFSVPLSTVSLLLSTLRLFPPFFVLFVLQVKYFLCATSCILVASSLPGISPLKMKVLTTCGAELYYMMQCVLQPCYACLYRVLFCHIKYRTLCYDRMHVGVVW